MDNFIGKTATHYYFFGSGGELWCDIEPTRYFNEFESFPTMETETILYIKKGVEKLTMIDLADLDKNATVNYFYCQPKGDYITWAAVEKELEEKRLMQEFDN
jgi:hypothetical protein